MQLIYQEKEFKKKNKKCCFKYLFSAIFFLIILLFIKPLWNYFAPKWTVSNCSISEFQIVNSPVYKKQNKATVYTKVYWENNIGEQLPIYDLRNKDIFFVFNPPRSKLFSFRYNLTTPKVKLLKSENCNTNISIVMDISGSMGGLVSGNEYISKMELAKKSLIKTLKQIDNQPVSNFQFSLLPLYGKSVDLKFEKFDNKIWTSDYQDVINQVGMLNFITDSHTPLYAALNNSMDELIKSQSSNKIIICLTDGTNDLDSLNESPIILGLSEVDITKKAVENNIKIYTIGYLNDKDSKSKEKLINLSNKSGAGSEGLGSVISDKPDSLSLAFDYIVNNINQSLFSLIPTYQIEFTIKGIDGNEVIPSHIIVYHKFKNKKYQKIIKLNY